MSLRQKTPGDFSGSRTAGGRTYGQVTRQYSHLTPSGSSKSDNRVSNMSSLGDKPATMEISSHNDINRFTSGISSHHPYKERGGAFDTTKQQWQEKNDNRSYFCTPSGGGTGKRASMTMGSTQRPRPYDDIMTENRHPADPSRGNGHPAGPKGGTVALMNRMKRAGVNKMGKRG